MTNLPLTLFYSNQAARINELSALRLRFERGEVTRIGVGVYVDTAAWLRSSDDEQYRTRIFAAATKMPPDLLFCHLSAAALYRLPNLNEWPVPTHQLAPFSGGGRSTKLITRHSRGPYLHHLNASVVPGTAATSVDGIGVTSLARTVVDIALTLSFTQSVAMIDDALRPPSEEEFRWQARIPPVTKPQLFELLKSLHPRRGARKAFDAISFADGASGSPMESFSRVQFRALGYPPPILQKQIIDAAGSVGFVDFYWPHLGLVVEYDGHTKYGDSRKYQQNVSASSLVWAEKMREDRIRRVVPQFTRIFSKTVHDLRTLDAALAPFGLRSDSASASRRHAPKPL